jgi:hypothetical protein
MDIFMVPPPLVKGHNVELLAANTADEQNPFTLNPDRELDLCESLHTEELPSFALCTIY